MPKKPLPTYYAGQYIPHMSRKELIENFQSILQVAQQQREQHLTFIQKVTAKLPPDLGQALADITDFENIKAVYNAEEGEK